MNHKPLITLYDKTEITYSDIKYDDNDEKYIEMHFETPDDVNFFNHLSITYPGEKILSIEGYSEEEFADMMEYYNKLAKLAFSFALEDENS